MKYLKQFGIIMLITFIGEIFHYVIPLPIPASIYGIIIMFFCLHFKWIPLSQVRETGKLLVEIMPVMFIPAAVGLIESWSIIKPSFLQYIIIVLVSTVAVMAVSGKVTQIVIRHDRKAVNSDD